MSRTRLLHTVCIIVLVVSMTVCLLAGCSRGISGPMVKGNVTASPNPTSSQVMLEAVQQTPESILNDGELGKAETLLDVTVTIPWAYFGEDFDAKAHNEEKGFISTTVHENGNVSFTMSKARYEDLLLERAAAVEDFFNRIMINGIHTPYVKAITSTEGFSKVAVDVDRAGYKKDITDLTCYEVWSSVQLYQYYLGLTPQCEVSVYDVLTGDLIKTITYPKSGAASVGDSTAPIAETTPIPATLADIKIDFMTDDNLIAVEKADINLDGKADTVQLYRPYSPGGEFEQYALQVGEVKICIEQYGCELYLGLADIDKNDKFIEMAVSSIGDSDFAQTSFFRYDGKSIIQLGTMDGFYGEYRSDSYFSTGDVVVNGSGVVRTQTRGDILHTWYYNDEFIVEDNALERVSKDLYLMNQKVTVIEEITLKKSRTDASLGITLKVGEIVTIKETDNKKWCSVVNSKGETGWFEVYDFSMIKGTKKGAAGFFDGLDYAG